MLIFGKLVGPQKSETLNLEVSPDLTVNGLIAIVRRARRVHVHSVLFAGKVIRGNNSLSSYNITKETTIQINCTYDSDVEKEALSPAKDVRDVVCEFNTYERLGETTITSPLHPDLRLGSFLLVRLNKIESIPKSLLNYQHAIQCQLRLDSCFGESLPVSPESAVWNSHTFALQTETQSGVHDDEKVMELKIVQKGMFKTLTYGFVSLSLSKVPSFGEVVDMLLNIELSDSLKNSPHSKAVSNYGTISISVRRGNVLCPEHSAAVHSLIATLPNPLTSEASVSTKYTLDALLGATPHIPSHFSEHLSVFDFYKSLVLENPGSEGKKRSFTSKLLRKTLKVTGLVKELPVTSISNDEGFELENHNSIPLTLAEGRRLALYIDPFWPSPSEPLFLASRTTDLVPLPFASCFLLHSLPYCFISSFCKRNPAAFSMPRNRDVVLHILRSQGVVLVHDQLTRHVWLNGIPSTVYPSFIQTLTRECSNANLGFKNVHISCNNTLLDIGFYTAETAVASLGLIQRTLSQNGLSNVGMTFGTSIVTHGGIKNGVFSKQFQVFGPISLKYLDPCRVNDPSELTADVSIEECSSLQCPIGFVPTCTILQDALYNAAKGEHLANLNPTSSGISLANSSVFIDSAWRHALFILSKCHTKKENNSSSPIQYELLQYFGSIFDVKTYPLDASNIQLIQVEDNTFALVDIQTRLALYIRSASIAFAVPSPVEVASNKASLAKFYQSLNLILRGSNDGISTSELVDDGISATPSIECLFPTSEPIDWKIDTDVETSLVRCSVCPAKLYPHEIARFHCIHSTDDIPPAFITDSAECVRILQNMSFCRPCARRLLLAGVETHLVKLSVTAKHNPSLYSAYLQSPRQIMEEEALDFHLAVAENAFEVEGKTTIFSTKLMGSLESLFETYHAKSSLRDIPIPKFIGAKAWFSIISPVLLTPVDAEDLLTYSEFERFQELKLFDLINRDDNYFRCPCCSMPMMSAKTLDHFYETYSLHPQTNLSTVMNVVTNRPLTEQSKHHYMIHRYRCRQCDANFCSSCNISPYHAGYGCMEYKFWKTSQHCRFCGDTVPLKGSNGMNCNETSCRENGKIACTIKRDCGHWCDGVLDDDHAHCVACMHPDCERERHKEKAGQETETSVVLQASLFSGSSSCPICRRGLRLEPVILLDCGHAVHFLCAKKRISPKWKKSRIDFAFLNCSLCAVPMSHRRLNTFFLRRLRRKVQMLSYGALVAEGLQNHHEIIAPKGQFFQDPVGFAVERYSYHQCSKCVEPYFAGTRQQDAMDCDFLCIDCMDKERGRVSEASYCTIHGKDFVLYKSLVKLRSDNSKRSLEISHPSNSSEYSLGCFMCNTTDKEHLHVPNKTFGVKQRSDGTNFLLFIRYTTRRWNNVVSSLAPNPSFDTIGGFWVERLGTRSLDASQVLTQTLEELLSESCTRRTEVSAESEKRMCRRLFKRFDPVIAYPPHQDQRALGMVRSLAPPVYIGEEKKSHRAHLAVLGFDLHQDTYPTGVLEIDLNMPGALNSYIASAVGIHEQSVSFEDNPHDQIKYKDLMEQKKMTIDFLKTIGMYRQAIISSFFNIYRMPLDLSDNVVAQENIAQARLRLKKLSASLDFDLQDLNERVILTRDVVVAGTTHYEAVYKNNPASMVLHKEADFLKTNRQPLESEKVSRKNFDIKAFDTTLAYFLATYKAWDSALQDPVLKQALGLSKSLRKLEESAENLKSNMCLIVLRFNTAKITQEEIGKARLALKMACYIASNIPIGEEEAKLEYEIFSDEANTMNATSKITPTEKYWSSLPAINAKWKCAKNPSKPKTISRLVTEKRLKHYIAVRSLRNKRLSALKHSQSEVLVGENSLPFSITMTGNSLSLPPLYATNTASPLVSEAVFGVSQGLSVDNSAAHPLLWYGTSTAEPFRHIYPCSTISVRIGSNGRPNPVYITSTNEDVIGNVYSPFPVQNTTRIVQIPGKYAVGQETIVLPETEALEGIIDSLTFPSGGKMSNQHPEEEPLGDASLFLGFVATTALPRSHDTLVEVDKLALSVAQNFLRDAALGTLTSSQLALVVKAKVMVNEKHGEDSSNINTSDHATLLVLAQLVRGTFPPSLFCSKPGVFTFIDYRDLFFCSTNPDCSNNICEGDNRDSQGGISEEHDNADKSPFFTKKVTPRSSFILSNRGYVYIDGKIVDDFRVTPFSIDDSIDFEINTDAAQISFCMNGATTRSVHVPWVLSNDASFIACLKGCSKEKIILQSNNPIQGSLHQRTTLNFVGGVMTNPLFAHNKLFSFKDAAFQSGMILDPIAISSKDNHNSERAILNSTGRENENSAVIIRATPSARFISSAVSDFQDYLSNSGGVFARSRIPRGPMGQLPFRLHRPVKFLSLLQEICEQIDREGYSQAHREMLGEWKVIQATGPHLVTSLENPGTIVSTWGIDKIYFLQKSSDYSIEKEGLLRPVYAKNFLEGKRPEDVALYSGSPFFTKLNQALPLAPRFPFISMVEYYIRPLVADPTTTDRLGKLESNTIFDSLSEKSPGKNMMSFGFCHSSYQASYDETSGSKSFGMMTTGRYFVDHGFVPLCDEEKDQFESRRAIQFPAFVGIGINISTGQFIVTVNGTLYASVSVHDATTVAHNLKEFLNPKGNSLSSTPVIHPFLEFFSSGLKATLTGAGAGPFVNTSEEILGWLHNPFTSGKSGFSQYVVKNQPKLSCAERVYKYLARSQRHLTSIFYPIRVPTPYQVLAERSATSSLTVLTPSSSQPSDLNVESTTDADVRIRVLPTIPSVILGDDDIHPNIHRLLATIRSKFDFHSGNVTRRPANRSRAPESNVELLQEPFVRHLINIVPPHILYDTSVETIMRSIDYHSWLDVALASMRAIVAIDWSSFFTNIAQIPNGYELNGAGFGARDVKSLFNMFFSCIPLDPAAFSYEGLCGLVGLTPRSTSHTLVSLAGRPRPGGTSQRAAATDIAEAWSSQPAISRSEQLNTSKNLVQTGLLHPIYLHPHRPFKSEEDEEKCESSNATTESKIQHSLTTDDRKSDVFLQSFYSLIELATEQEVYLRERAICTAFTDPYAYTLGEFEAMFAKISAAHAAFQRVVSHIGNTLDLNGEMRVGIVDEIPKYNINYTFEPFISSRDMKVISNRYKHASFYNTLQTKAQKGVYIEPIARYKSATGYHIFSERIIPGDPGCVCIVPEKNSHLRRIYDLYVLKKLTNKRYNCDMLGVDINDSPNHLGLAVPEENTALSTSTNMTYRVSMSGLCSWLSNVLALEGLLTNAFIYYGNEIRRLYGFNEARKTDALNSLNNTKTFIFSTYHLADTSSVQKQFSFQEHENPIPRSRPVEDLPESLHERMVDFYIPPRCGSLFPSTVNEIGGKVIDPLSRVSIHKSIEQTECVLSNMEYIREYAANVAGKKVTLTALGNDVNGSCTNFPFSISIDGAKAVDGILTELNIQVQQLVKDTMGLNDKLHELSLLEDPYAPLTPSSGKVRRVEDALFSSIVFATVKAQGLIARAYENIFQHISPSYFASLVDVPAEGPATFQSELDFKPGQDLVGINAGRIYSEALASAHSTVYISRFRLYLRRSEIILGGIVVNGTHLSPGSVLRAGSFVLRGTIAYTLRITGFGIVDVLTESWQLLQRIYVPAFQAPLSTLDRFSGSFNNSGISSSMPLFTPNDTNFVTEGEVVCEEIISSADAEKNLLKKIRSSHIELQQVLFTIHNIYMNKSLVRSATNLLHHTHVWPTVEPIFDLSTSFALSKPLSLKVAMFSTRYNLYIRESIHHLSRICDITTKKSALEDGRSLTVLDSGLWSQDNEHQNISSVFDDRSRFSCVHSKTFSTKTTTESAFSFSEASSGVSSRPPYEHGLSLLHLQGQHLLPSKWSTTSCIGTAIGLTMMTTDEPILFVPSSSGLVIPRFDNIMVQKASQENMLFESQTITLPILASHLGLVPTPTPPVLKSEKLEVENRQSVSRSEFSVPIFSLFFASSFAHRRPVQFYAPSFLSNGLLIDFHQETSNTSLTTFDHLARWPRNDNHLLLPALSCDTTLPLFPLIDGQSFNMEIATTPETFGSASRSFHNDYSWKNLRFSSRDEYVHISTNLTDIPANKQPFYSGRDKYSFHGVVNASFKPPYVCSKNNVNYSSAIYPLSDTAQVSCMELFHSITTSQRLRFFVGVNPAVMKTTSANTKPAIAIASGISLTTNSLTSSSCDNNESRKIIEIMEDDLFEETIDNPIVDTMALYFASMTTSTSSLSSSEITGLSPTRPMAFSKPEIAKGAVIPHLSSSLPLLRTSRLVDRAIVLGTNAVFLLNLSSLARRWTVLAHQSRDVTFQYIQHLLTSSYVKECVLAVYSTLHQNTNVGHDVDENSIPQSFLSSLLISIPAFDRNSHVSILAKSLERTMDAPNAQLPAWSGDPFLNQVVVDSSGQVMNFTTYADAMQFRRGTVVYCPALDVAEELSETDIERLLYRNLRLDIPRKDRFCENTVEWGNSDNRKEGPTDLTVEARARALVASSQLSHTTLQVGLVQKDDGLQTENEIKGMYLHSHGVAHFESMNMIEGTVVEYNGFIFCIARHSLRNGAFAVMRYDPVLRIMVEYVPFVPYFFSDDEMTSMGDQDQGNIVDEMELVMKEGPMPELFTQAFVVGHHLVVLSRRPTTGSDIMAHYYLATGVDCWILPLSWGLDVSPPAWRKILIKWDTSTSSPEAGESMLALLLPSATVVNAANCIYILPSAFSDVGTIDACEDNLATLPQHHVGFKVATQEFDHCYQLVLDLDVTSNTLSDNALFLKRFYTTSGSFSDYSSLSSVPMPKDVARSKPSLENNGSVCADIDVNGVDADVSAFSKFFVNGSLRKCPLSNLTVDGDNSSEDVLWKHPPLNPRGLAFSRGNLIYTHIEAVRSLPVNVNHELFDELGNRKTHISDSTTPISVCANGLPMGNTLNAGSEPRSEIEHGLTTRLYSKMLVCLDLRSMMWYVERGFASDEYIPVPFPPSSLLFEYDNHVATLSNGHVSIDRTITYQ